jgi:MbtH protein
MSTGLYQQEIHYDVVVNREGQYSLWPINKIVAKGWSTTGARGSKEACLAFIDEAWIDMRPRSLQAFTHSS